MANTLHDQLTGPDLHANKIDSITGTELTVPSQAICDNRWQSKGSIAGLQSATSTQAGVLSSADWATFNGKQSNLGYIPVNKAGDTMTGKLVAALIDNGGQFYSILAYGAKADAIKGTGASIAAGSAILTVAAGAFTAADVGKGITVIGAGPSGTDRRTTIVSVQSATQVTLAGTAGTTASNTAYYYGTLTHTPLQNAINAAVAAGGGIVFIPPGSYFFNIQRVTIASNVTVIGAGIDVTILLGGTAGDYTFYNSSTPVTNFVLRDLTIDCNNLTNASCTQFYYCNHTVIERVKFKNAPSGGWLCKWGVPDAGTDNTLGLDNKMIDCEFDGHGGSLEMLLVFNQKNMQIVRPKFRNKTSIGPGLGLWQKCYNTRIIDPDFKDMISPSTIYYSYTCDNTTVLNPYFENAGGITGGNSSDYGEFGATAIYNLTIINPTFKAPNTPYYTAIELGSVNGATIINPKIEGYQIGILMQGRGTPNTATVNVNIIDPIIKNGNPENAVWGLHPGIMFGQPASSNVHLLGGQIYDDQVTKTQRYPIIFSGADTWSNITINGMRLQADTATGGVSVYKNNAGGVLDSTVAIANNTDYSGNNPAQGGIFGKSVRVPSSNTPSSATATGVQGDICWDANFVYICTTTNTWKRVAIGSW